MSTNYYLHSPDFPESMHVGKTSALGQGEGYEWRTDTSDARFTAALDGAVRWTDTTTLRDYLASLAGDERAWVADEYGKTFTPRAALKIVVRAAQIGELDREFS